MSKMQQLEKTSNYTNETFESIKHIDETGAEYLNILSAPTKWC